MTDVKKHSSSDAIKSTPPSRSAGTRTFLSFLAAIAGFYLLILGYHFLVPKTVKATESPAFLERCRQICESYGLVPSGRIDDDARDFLDAAQQERLSGKLSDILSNDAHKVAEPHSHSLIGQPAPEFSLLNPNRQRIPLEQLNAERPVVIIFYYGYFCSHCVAQLFAINDDLKYFEEVGATVIAISADLPESTSQQYARYGEFDFTVLSDPDNSVAAAYEVFTSATESDDEDLKHGTFVIDKTGTVVWAQTDHTPFTDNESLLKIIDSLQ